MPVTGYTDTEGLPALLVDAPTLLSAVSGGTTGSVVTDSLSPAADGEAFLSTSSSINIQVRNYTPTIPTPSWYIIYIDLRAVNPISTDTLQISMSDSIDPPRPLNYSYNLQVLPTAIPTNSYITVSALYPLYDEPTIIVSGVSTNGLYIARIRVEDQLPSLHLLQCRVSKILYNTTETDGYINVNVSNLTGGTLDATFTLTLNSEFDITEEIYTGVVSVPANATNTAYTTIQLPLSQMNESGYEISVNMVSGSTNETVNDFFYVSNYPARFGHCGALGVGNSIYQNNGYGTIDSLRGYYFNLTEIDFWAPDDTLYQSLPPSPSPNPPPNLNQWWSGQSLNRVSTGEILDMIQYGHNYGMKILSYSNLRYNFGWRSKEFFRQYPQFCNWDDHSGHQNISVSGQDEQENESDAQRFNKNGSSNFGESGVWSNATGDPGLISWHVNQLQQAMQFWGFDGFRYDDTYIYDYAEVSMQGNVLPFPEFDNTYILATIRSAIHAVNPYAVYGHNMEMWQGDMPVSVAMPTTNTSFRGDYYTELMQCEGLHLQERWSDDIGGQTWVLIASNLFAIGYNAWRFGGNAYLITGITSQSANDQKIGVALMLASLSHLYGGGSITLLGYLQLAARYSRLIWGKNIINLQNQGTNPLALTSTNNVWWQNYVYMLQLTPTRTIYYVHVINQPTNATMGNSTLQAPATVNLTWTLPTDVIVNAAWTITADGSTTPYRIYSSIAGQYSNIITDTVGINTIKTSASYTQTGTSVTMTVSNIMIWTIIIIDCGTDADIQLSGIQSDETFGTASTTRPGFADLLGIKSSETFGIIQPPNTIGTGTREQFGVPTTSTPLSVSLVGKASEEKFGIGTGLQNVSQPPWIAKWIGKPKSIKTPFKPQTGGTPLK